MMRRRFERSRRRERHVRQATVLVGLTLLSAACAGPNVSPATSPSSAAVSAGSPTSGTPIASRSVSPSPHLATPLPALPLFGQLPEAKLDAARATALQAVLVKAVADGAPDAIAAVITPDGVWSGAAGISGPKGRRATAEDEFAIASVTKTFTAALVLRLVEQGRMDIDAPLANYMGDLDVDTNGATVKQALEMRAGIGDDGDDVADQIVADPARVWTSAETVTGLSRFAEPGQTFLYSSPTYRLLAIAAQHVTGKSFATALRAELLDGVHADRILDQGPEAATPKPWALPIESHVGRYQPGDLGAGGAISCISSATRSTGSSSMASDAPSLAAWVWHLFAGDIVKPATLESMRPHDATGFGRGLESESLDSQLAYGLAGNKTGYGSLFVVFPERQVVIVMLVNDPGFVVEPVVSDLLKAATAS